jgi:hypothetical protein
MLRKSPIYLIAVLVLSACTSEGEICDCWKELVTKEGNRKISEGCEYILEMSHDEITAEAGPDCVEEINKLLFDDDDIEFEEEIDENAMIEQGDY